MTRPLKALTLLTMPETLWFSHHSQASLSAPVLAIMIAL
jgi:hypothetical protein